MRTGLHGVLAHRSQRNGEGKVTGCVANVDDLHQFLAEQRPEQRAAWKAEHVQELREAKLFDVSLVSFPAYVGTSVEARSVSPKDAEIGTYSGIVDAPVSDEERRRLELRLDLRRL